ncbi:17419_t:CDS:2, partial [Acaulospora morrowiae]
YDNMKYIKKGERQSYSVEEKAAVVRFALASNNVKAAVHFGINKSLISKWVGGLKSQLDNLKNRKSCHVGAGRKEFFPAEEKQLFAWFLQMREAALAITYNSLKIEMLKIWPKAKDVLPPPPNINISFHEKGWMDEERMMSWTCDFAKKRPGSYNKEPVLLVYDSFKAHLTNNIKEKMKKTNTDLVIIPGGLTSMCQPLDVSINHPFKAALRHHWHTWMASGGAGKTVNGNLKRASLHTVCKWVLAAWDEINPEIIQRAFRKCCISNALDGSEDDEIFDESACGDKSDMEINVYKDNMEYRDNENNEEICEDDIIEENGN